MGSTSVPGEPINQYALVTYLPAELGAYLDQLRKELVTSCQARSHLSILPPRPLAVPINQAESQLDRFARRMQPTVIKVGNVEVFPLTGVIYLELQSGQQQIESMHASLNSEAFAFDEPYPFHPHITLAQNFLPCDSPRCLDLGRQRWAEYTGPREFLLDRVVFVQNSCTNCWSDLRTFKLEGMPDMPPVMQPVRVSRNY
jgi:2'-5' RNA ligase